MSATLDFFRADTAHWASALPINTDGEHAMKGMLNFLEKAGLVTRDTPLPEPELSIHLTPLVQPLASNPVSPAEAKQPEDASLPATAGTPIDLDAIYAHAGIGPAIYPAERLLRLLDGLSAMDEATRLLAIKAMDAADESWTIADPLADAAAKLTALATHAERLRLELQQREQQTQAQLDSVQARQTQVVDEIRKQISELEALVARELDRSAQEVNKHQASLAAARTQTARDLSDIAQASQRLQSLASQFGTANPRPQE